MKNIKIFDRRLGFSLGAASILFGALAPAIVPAFASADSQITSRSVQMSNSAPGATGVSYKVTFTPNEGNGSDVYMIGLEFCNNTPLIGQTCDSSGLTGMQVGNSTSGPGASGAGGTITGTATHALKSNDGSAFLAGANFIDFAEELPNESSATPDTITISGVTNPNPGPGDNVNFYARVMIYGVSTAPTSLNSWEVSATSSDPSFKLGAQVDGSGSETVADIEDDGSVAMVTNSQIGVQAAVLESLQFCVYGDSNNNTPSADGTANAAGYLGALADSTDGPGLNCNDNDATNGGHANSNPSPSVTLGQVASDVSSLSTTTNSYAAEWAQLSTNANTGAVVYLKTNNTCVGLSRNNGTSCQIPGPDAGVGGDTSGGKLGHALAAGTAGFGLNFGAVESAGTGSSGTLSANSAYTSNFAMLDSTATAATDSNGTSLPVDTTSTYGGYVFGSHEAAVASQDMPFALGAAIANNTPAGLYKANLDLIAVGTF